MDKWTGRIVWSSYLCMQNDPWQFQATMKHILSLTAWLPSSLSKFHGCWLQSYHYWIYFWKRAWAKYLPFHSKYIHKGPTICTYSEKIIWGESPKGKESALGRGRAGRQYSQRSEAQQLLESVHFNFIDFIMSQVSEMTEFQRLISKWLVSKICPQRTFTEELPALNQRKEHMK